MFHDSVASLLQLFPYALICGLLIAVVCAFLGVFVILKRVVFIGITLSEIAACGIALALVTHIPPVVGAILLTLAGVLVLSLPVEYRRIPKDAVLGVLFVTASSMSVLLVSQSAHGLQEIKSLLYGDLILATSDDMRVIAAILVPSLMMLVVYIRPMIYSFLDRETSSVMGLRPARWELLFFLILGVVVAVASKIAGSLLVFCYLIIPATSALLMARRLWVVLLISVTVSTISTVIGMTLSLAADLPTNQTICVTMCGMLLLVLPRILLQRN